MLEVHLFDFERDIYGKHVRVDFLHKFRDEEKYADVETLKRQIALDVENAKVFFGRKDAKAPRNSSAEFQWRVSSSDRLAFLFPINANLAFMA